MTDTPLACGSCRQPMQRLALAGHYGQKVEVDLCPLCHLLWFDSLESSRLTGTSMLALLGQMAAAHARPHHALAAAPACPRCSAGLKAVVNRSRFGRAEQLECRAGHGSYSTFGQWLAERGLVRPLSSADRAAFAARAREGGDWNCVNCGAPLADGHATDCRFCGSLAGVFDIARMAGALDPQGATEAMAIHRTARAAHTFNCHACGHSAEGLEGTACPQCGATLISTDLAAVHRRLVELADPLAAHEKSPAPHVRERRMKALEADLGRRREHVLDLERSSQGGKAGTSFDPEGAPVRTGSFWLDALMAWIRGLPWPWQVVAWVVFALVVAFNLGLLPPRG